MALFNNKQFFFLAAAAGLTGYWLYKQTGKALNATGEALNAINPLNRENIISENFNEAFENVTGVELGDVIWDLTAHESDRILWTNLRSKQLVKEAADVGIEVTVDLMLEKNKVAMKEWNKNHTRWWKRGDHWEDRFLETGRVLDIYE